MLPACKSGVYNGTVNVTYSLSTAVTAAATVDIAADFAVVAAAVVVDVVVVSVEAASFNGQGISLLPDPVTQYDPIQSNEVWIVE